VARQHLETDAAHAEVVNEVDEVAQVAPQPVKLPDDECVPATQRLKCRIESRPSVEAAGGAILVESARGNAAARSASRCRSVLCDPSAFDTRI
jgi:hypothetical protein